MRKIRCYECGKSYDFDVDDFCPKCGAFNQPGKRTGIGAGGAVIRSEGINEKNHVGSCADLMDDEFELVVPRYTVGVSPDRLDDAAMLALQQRVGQEEVNAWLIGAALQEVEVVDKDEQIEIGRASWRERV